MSSRARHLITALTIKVIQRLSPPAVEINGRTFLVSRDVFNPKYYVTSQFMAENLDIKRGDVVLDMGTGSGVQAIFAAEVASRVVGVDINPEAVKIARENVAINDLRHKVDIREGDLFSPIRGDERFHVIIFTPPYLEGRIRTRLDSAIFDPGKSILKRFFEDCAGYLCEDGYVLMLYSSIANPGQALEIAVERGWQWETVAIKKIMLETFIIYKFIHKEGEPI